jgi:hypothetical protein
MPAATTTIECSARMRASAGVLVVFFTPMRTRTRGSRTRARGGRAGGRRQPRRAAGRRRRRAWRRTACRRRRRTSRASAARTMGTRAPCIRHRRRRRRRRWRRCHHRRCCRPEARRSMRARPLRRRPPRRRSIGRCCRGLYRLMVNDSALLRGVLRVMRRTRSCALPAASSCSYGSCGQVSDVPAKRKALQPADVRRRPKSITAHNCRALPLSSSQRISLAPQRASGCVARSRRACVWQCCTTGPASGATSLAPRPCASRRMMPARSALHLRGAASAQCTRGARLQRSGAPAARRQRTLPPALCVPTACTAALDGGALASALGGALSMLGDALLGVHAASAAEAAAAALPPADELSTEALSALAAAAVAIGLPTAFTLARASTCVRTRAAQPAVTRAWH